jgi:hypothetical protein
MRRMTAAYKAAMEPVAKSVEAFRREVTRRLLHPTPEELALRFVWRAVDESQDLVQVPEAERRQIVLETRAYVRGAMGQPFGSDWVWSRSHRRRLDVIRSYMDGLRAGGYTAGHVPAP